MNIELCESYLQVLKIMPVPTMVVDINGTVIEWNNAMVKLTGIDSFVMINKGNYEYSIPFYGERRPILVDFAMLQDKDIEDLYPFIRRNIDTISSETYVSNLKGNFFYLNCNATAIRNSNGDIIGAIETLTDITERKIAEDNLTKLLVEKECLFRELHHRIRNNISTLSGLVSLEAKLSNDKSTQNALLNVRDRIQTFAKLYDTLYFRQSGEEICLDQYFRSLCDFFFSAYVTINDHIELKLQLDTIHISLKKAIPLGLILNELLTNSLKHAFPEHRGGIILVQLKCLDNTILLNVEDDGIGLLNNEESFHQSSIGLKLIQMMATQLKGRVEFKSENGTKCAVTLNMK